MDIADSWLNIALITGGIFALIVLSIWAAK